MTRLYLPLSHCPAFPFLDHKTEIIVKCLLQVPSTPPRHADAASGAYASGTCRAGPRDAELAAANVSAFPACVSGLHGMRWHASCPINTFLALQCDSASVGHVL